MKCYMVNIALPEEYTPEFLSLIPSQRAYINKLMGRGVVSTYTLSLDRTTLWVTMFGDSSVDIEAYLDRFPMKDFMDFLKEWLVHLLSSYLSVVCRYFVSIF